MMYVSLHIQAKVGGVIRVHLEHVLNLGKLKPELYPGRELGARQQAILTFSYVTTTGYCPLPLRTCCIACSPLTMC